MNFECIYSQAFCFIGFELCVEAPQTLALGFCKESLGLNLTKLTVFQHELKVPHQEPGRSWPKGGNQGKGISLCKSTTLYHPLALVCLLKVSY